MKIIITALSVTRLACFAIGALAVSATLSLSGVASAGVAGCPGGGSSGVSYIFDCRAYELVSPSYKEGFQVGAVGVSEDGSHVLAASVGVFARSTGGDLQYEFLRSPLGWMTSAGLVGAPFPEFPVYTVEGVSPGFQSTLVFASTLEQVLAEEKDVYLRLPDGSLVLVGPLEPPVRAGVGLYLAGSSEDMRRAVFVTESAFAWPGDTTLRGAELPSLYEYEYTGQAAREPRLVGIDNVGVPESVGAGHLISDCGAVLGSFPSLKGDAYNAVSASGAAVFFTAGKCSEPGEPPVNEVYARFRETPTMPAHTVAVSEPPLSGPGSVPGRECAGPCEETEKNLGRNEGPGERQEGVFAGASSDGSKVFFLTRQSLLDGDEEGKGMGQDLYEADIGEGALTRLVQVSRGGVGDPTPGSGAHVLGVARVSQDGSHVYFVAEGQLTGANREGKTPAEKSPNLYVYDTVTGGTSFVATLSPGDLADWSPTDNRPVQATPDGRFLVFQSTADLTPDQTGRVEAGQVFEYDAEAETLVRVSRGEGGYDEDGSSDVYAATIPAPRFAREERVGNGRFLGLAVSADGSRVFFSTRDALTPQASNGIVNVYEYHAGHVGLISDGHDGALTVEGRPAVELVGTDESGRDVFFTTADRLVPQDTDDQVDLYDARVEGGFAPPLEAAPCGGDSCQASPSVSPSLLVPGAPSSTGGTPPPGPASQSPAVARPTVAQVRAAKLAKALKACRAKRNGRRRTVCERAARKRYLSEAGKISGGSK